jgi:hypothetical protein
MPTVAEFMIGIVEPRHIDRAPSTLAMVRVSMEQWAFVQVMEDL